MRRTDDSPVEMTARALVPFFVLTFTLTWGLAALLVLFPDTMTALFGDVNFTNPLYILAIYAPGIVGVLLVWRHSGLRGLGSYFRRLTQWRMPVAWWAFLIVGIPAIFYLGAAFKGTIGDPFPFDPWTAVLPALLATLLIGPMEEFGWRGVGLPLLQRKLAPIWAGLVLGGIWALWHAPAFMFSGTPQSNWSLPAFFVGMVSLSVILTQMFNAARGSLLVAVLLHVQTNGPAWPDAQPWDALVFVVAAVIVVWLNRETMFSRGAGATNVRMAEDENAAPQAHSSSRQSPGRSGRRAADDLESPAFAPPKR